MEPRALVLFSGGQDSTTCLAWAKQNFSTVEAITFDYGQTHAIELACARDICTQLQVRQTTIDMKFLQQLHSNALTDASVEIDNHNDTQELPSTFVPGRNALFLTTAAAYAIPKNIHNLIIGACEVDYSGYPDCRQAFIDAQNKALQLAMGEDLSIHTPLMHKSKADTFALADELGCLKMIIEHTHTCYRGNRLDKHAWGFGCDHCPACQLRKNGYEQYQFTKSTRGKI